MKKEEVSLTYKVWARYRYLTIYASAVSSILLFLQLRGK
jgi:hypothetical protein